MLEGFTTARPVGSGLLLQPSGLAALRALGLADAILDAGARIERLEGLDLAGRKLMRMDYATWRPGAFGLGVHRAALFEVLLAAVTAAGVEVRPAAFIEAIDSVEPYVLLRDGSDNFHGPFEMAVIASGSATGLRVELRPEARAPMYPWGAVWANAVDVDGRFAGALHQRYDRASTMVGVLPIGRAPDGRGDLVSLFWSLPTAELGAFFDGDFDAWRRRVADLWPQTGPLLDQFESAAEFSSAIYRDVEVRRWSNGAAVLIGDAAHGTSPQLGQGANLALIDAVELAARVLTPADLLAYERARRAQTGPYQVASRLLTPLFQSHGALGPWVRNWLFAPLSQAPGLDRIAASVLTGGFRLGPTPPELRP